jgi:hypothetical protein
VVAAFGPADRPAFAEGVRHAVGTYTPFTEQVQVTTLLARSS